MSHPYQKGNCTQCTTTEQQKRGDWQPCDEHPSTANPTLKAQVEEIIQNHCGCDMDSELPPCQKCQSTIAFILALITADRKAHSEAMVKAAKDGCYTREKGDAGIHDEEVEKGNPCEDCDLIRQALLQASARYQEGEGV